MRVERLVIAARILLSESDGPIVADGYHRAASELDFVESKGYLGWRYLDISTRPSHSDGSIGRHEIMASIVREDRELLELLVEEHGPFLDPDSGLARRAVVREFDQIKRGSWRTPVAAQKRRARLGLNFLRRSVALSFGGEDAVDELLDVLPLLKPPTPSRDNEIPRHVQAAFSILSRMIDLVSDLYVGDETARRRLLAQGRADLVGLRRGDYDYLCPGMSRQHPGLATLDLPFMVLPPGASIQSFVGKLQSSGHFRDHEEDAARTRVIEDLWGYFGSSRCTLYRGVFRPSEDGNGYVVIAIRRESGDEHAVAISPWKGEHATFVVRSDCDKREPWPNVLSRTKAEAKDVGAKRLVFSAGSDGSLDQYETMKRKIICLLECTPVEFEQGHFYFDQSRDRYVRRVRSSGGSSLPPTTPKRATGSPVGVRRRTSLLPPSRTPSSPGSAGGSRKPDRVNAISSVPSPSTVRVQPSMAHKPATPPAVPLSLWQRFLKWLRG